MSRFSVRIVAGVALAVMACAALLAAQTTYFGEASPLANLLGLAFGIGALALLVAVVWRRPALTKGPTASLALGLAIGVLVGAAVWTATYKEATTAQVSVPVHNESGRRLQVTLVLRDATNRTVCLGTLVLNPGDNQSLPCGSQPMGTALRLDAAAGNQTYDGDWRVDRYCGDVLSIPSAGPLAKSTWCT